MKEPKIKIIYSGEASEKTYYEYLAKIFINSGVLDKQDKTA